MKYRLRNLFSLKNDQADNEEIEKRISEGSALSGANIYILIFAILIASVGLNMDSTAVVIGAMLISPLMGVIISFAYGVASQNLDMMKKAFKGTFIQVAVSIITSTVYFFISPVNGFSGELLARTQPTFWDVLIAFFGGFSAIIALTRKNSVSNVIPGAAIATALMPPLCTTGYCLSHLEWLPAAGAIYLFTINAIFICVSGIIGLYLMKIVDVRKLINNKKQRKLLAFTIILAIIPSGFLAFDLVKQEHAEQDYEKFITSEFNYRHTEIVKSVISYRDKKINIFLIGSVISEKEMKRLEKSLPLYGLEDYTLHIVQASSEQDFTDEELTAVFRKEKLIADKKRSTEENMDADEGTEKNLISEIMILYPEIEEAGFTELTDKEKEKERSLVLKVREPLGKEKRNALEKWLRMKTGQEYQVEELPYKEKGK